VTGPRPYLPLGFNGLPQVPFDFDPTDPYGLLRPRQVDPAFQPDATTTMPPAAAAPSMGAGRPQENAQPRQSDFMRSLSEAGSAADAFLSGPMSGTLAGVAYQGGKMFLPPIAHDIGVLGKAALRQAGHPGMQLKPGEDPGTLDAAINLSVGVFYPIGGASKAEIEVAENALARGTILRTDEAERVIGRDALGNEITNRGRPIPRTANTRPVEPVQMAERPIRDPATTPVAGVNRFGGGRPRGTRSPAHQAKVDASMSGAVTVDDPGMTGIGLDPHAGSGDLPGPEQKRLPPPQEEEGKPKVGTIETGLLKEDAIGRVKSMKASGDNVELQRQPDGSWGIRRKGESQAVVKNKETSQVQLIQDLMKGHDENYQEFMAGEMKAATDALHTDPTNRTVESHRAAEIRHRAATNKREEFLEEAESLQKRLEAAQWEAARDPNAIGPKGGPIGDGEFQSRLMTSLEYGHQDAKALTPEEWYKRLSNDKNVPKAELDAVFSTHSTPESEAQFAAMKKRYDEIVEWRSDPENQPPNVPHAMRDGREQYQWETWHRKKDEIEKLSEDMRELQRHKRSWNDYMGKDGKISNEDMQRLVADESPVSSLEMTTHETDEASNREMTHEDIRAEMDNIMEQKRLEYVEERKNDMENSIGERDEALDDVEIALSPVMGEQEAKTWVEQFRAEYMRDPAEMLHASNEDLIHLANSDEHDDEVWESLEKYQPDAGIDYAKIAQGDPNQLTLPADMPSSPLAEAKRQYAELKREDDARIEEHRTRGQAGGAPALYGEEYNKWHNRNEEIDKGLLKLEDRIAELSSDGERRFGPSQWKHLKKSLARVLEHDQEAARASLDHDSPDIEDMVDRNAIEQEAIENLEETGEYGSGGDRDTEFHDYQRVDDSAPYREILIHQKGAGIRGGHFNESDDLVAHARGEIHGNTYLMIEAQSDFAQRLRGEAPKHVPFAETERWAQLSTGASLMRAAQEGKSYFAWVTPENRVDVANLAKEAADITYGHAVPKAVKKIFRWLDLPMKPERYLGSEAMRVKLTAEMRQRILKAGIPALGLTAAMIQTKSAPGKRQAGASASQD
jgi:hypothetical protein